MDIPLSADVEDIQLESALGMNGKVPGGLGCTPCGNYVVMPLGSTILLKNALRSQFFMEQHSGDISCLRLSSSGKMLVSGQESPGESKAEVVVWDLERAKGLVDKKVQRDPNIVKHVLLMHIGKVQAVDFSHDDAYVVSLGGRIDNQVLVWDLATGVPFCGAPAGTDTALCLRTLRTRTDRFVTGGNFHFRVWQFDAQAKKIQALDAKLGAMRRIIQCVDVDPADRFAYAGTTTGEMLKFRIDRDEIKDANQADKLLPVLLGYSRERFGMGIKSVLAVSKPGSAPFALVGSGDGTIAAITGSLFTASGQKVEVLGGVTSIVSANDHRRGYFACTNQSNWYYVSPEFKAELRGTCHYDQVNDVVFPRGCSELFVTCSLNDIRIWNASLRQEVIRIQVPSLKCTCLGITPNGGTIVSGWSDGKVRAFLPQSGKLSFVIPEAQPDGVTALAMVNDDETRPPWRIITGGVDGRIRVWNVHSSYQQMMVSLKEHRKDVTSITVTSDNRSFVSSSADGSCIIWDLVRLVRVGAVFAQTIFESVVFHPDSSQILTCGSNFKLTYWDCYDGNAIRDVPGGTATLKALDVRPEGDLFACGGEDRVLRVWSWDDGVVLGVGKGHSGTINKVRISPDGKNIVTCAADGSIFVWRSPAALTAHLMESPKGLRLPEIPQLKKKNNISSGSSHHASSTARSASTRSEHGSLHSSARSRGAGSSILPPPSAPGSGRWPDTDRAPSHLGSGRRSLSGAGGSTGRRSIG